MSGFRVAAALADNSVLKQILAPKNLPQELALHCANEYSQLAAFYLGYMAITQKCINEYRVEAMDAPKSAI